MNPRVIKKLVRAAGRAARIFFLLLLLGAAVVLLAVKYAFPLYFVPSGSMEPTLEGRVHDGDRVVSYTYAYADGIPGRWDIVAFASGGLPFIPGGADGVVPDIGQQSVKRVVGLPGERLAMARGDIWTRSGGRDAAFVRRAKPDATQRNLWIPVHEEDLSDLTMEEFSFHWTVSGDGTAAIGDAALRLSPGKTGLALAYRPRVRAGENGSSMAELPAVIDRYVFNQTVEFLCGECGTRFEKRVRAQNIQGRCPECGILLRETSVDRYNRRSGLAAIGPFMVDPSFAVQGELSAPRMSGYHPVPDIRARMEVRFGASGSRCEIELREDGRSVRASVTGEGGVEIAVDGMTAAAGTVAGFRDDPERWHAAEFYVVEGTARLFVDSTAAPALELAAWTDAKPPVHSLPEKTGLSIAVSGGEVELKNIAVDRDVFYYSGAELGYGEYFPALGDDGEAEIPSDRIFLLGDNCSSSFDSRVWGPVELARVTGKIIAVWWPPERARLF